MWGGRGDGDGESFNSLDILGKKTLLKEIVFQTFQDKAMKPLSQEGKL